MNRSRPRRPHSPSEAVLLLTSALALSVYAGCDTPSSTTTPDLAITGSNARAVEYLSEPERLIRISMAVRGLRPSPDDLALVEANPAALPTIVDRYLESPEFGDTIRELVDSALLMRIAPQIFPLGFPAVGPLAGQELTALNNALAEEPLRLVEYLVMNGRPWSEIVTADYTVANGAVAAVVGLPHSSAPENWEVARYTDGRPAAGILSSSMMYVRWSTTASNANRGRANAISRALLCFDFGAQPIPIEGAMDLSNPDAVLHLVQTNDKCASCHQALDPLAAHVYGFSPFVASVFTNSYPLASYSPPGSEPWSLAYGHVDPHFFGLPSSSLADLGRNIANDPRFTLCTAKRFYAFFNQLELDDVPPDEAARLQRAFIDDKLDARALVRRIVLSDSFRVVYAKDDPSDAPGLGLKRATPEQLARQFEGLTGFRWRTRIDLEILGPGRGTVGEVDLMNDPFVGYRVLAGGADDFFVTRQAHTFNAVSSLVLRRLAAEAANRVVDTDFAESDASRRHLLRSVEASTSDEASVRVQLVDLRWRLRGVRVASDDVAIDDAFAIWSAVFTKTDSVRRAWKVTLTALFQDPRMVTY